MQIKDQSTKNSVTKYSVTVNEQELSKIKDRVISAYRKKTTISGFRQGKAPKELVQKNIDQNVLENELINQAINDFYIESVNQLKPRIVGDPRIRLTKFIPFSELEFKVELDVISDIKMSDYHKIKIELKKKIVSSSDLKNTLEQLAERNALYKEVNRPLKLTDRASFDFDGFDQNNKKLDQASAKDFKLVLGSKTFIPGFEENMLGLKKAEQKEFILTFPKDYHDKSFQNKKVTFKVKVGKVEKAIKEPLSDQNVSSFGPFKNLKEFENEIKKQLENENEAIYQNQLDDQILSKLSEIIEVSIPDIIIEKEIEKIKEDDRRVAINKGLTDQEYLDSLKLTSEEYQKNIKELATKRIKSFLALSEIAQKEDIKIEQNEINSRIDFYKKRYQDPDSQQQINTDQFNRDIEFQLLTEKTLQKIKSELIPKN